MSGAAAANGGGGGGGGRTDVGPQRIVEIKHQLYSHKEEEDEDEQEDLRPLEENRHSQCHHHHIAAGLLVSSSSFSPASSSFTSATNWAQDELASSSSDPDASSIDSHYNDGMIPLEEEAMAPGEWKQRVFTILVAGTGFLADSYDLL